MMLHHWFIDFCLLFQTENGGGSPPNNFLTRKRVLSVAKNNLRRFAKRHYKRKVRQNGIVIWKKILSNAFNKLRRQSRCGGAKIITKVRSKMSDKKTYGYRNKYGRRRPVLKECREYGEPLYGFRVRIRLVENERCELGVTCSADGRKIIDEELSTKFRRQSVFNFDRMSNIDRQTGESFLSAAPVDCRTTKCTKK